MISPSCYPVVGAEAIVNIKLLKALSDSGQFSIDLITRRWKWAQYPSDTLDSFDVKLNSIEIVEVDNVININTIIQNILTYLKFGILYKGYHWAYPAWKVVRKKIQKSEYDYVLTKDVPSLLLGCYLKKQYGLKWVATWNDPCPWTMYPKPYGRGLNAELSKMHQRIISIMREADIHIFPNPRIRDYMNRYLQIEESKCIVIPHVILPPSEKTEHKYAETLRLIHSGNLGHPRNPNTFLRALRSFLDKNPNAMISFTIMGHCNNSVKDFISDLKLEEYVFFTTPVEYKESLNKLSDYDIAVIIEADCEEGIFLPTKVSDFLQMSIPIFAVSPQIGILNDLHKDKQVPYFAPVNDENLISLEIERVYKDFENKSIQKVNSFSSYMTSDYVVKQYLSL